MNQAVQQVINHFPSQEERIWQLWQADEDFQEVCHDYTLCLETLSRWAVAATTQQTQEYLSLRRRLEFEIEMKIENGKENHHEN
ncbi:hypothetical protein [Candidatus Leptofilum sp.]|uniref:hypothetical protein n=1 Tax=Candidatus Leptofilum sp. TaxID=3241576 RepID=UPI003B5BC913